MVRRLCKNITWQENEYVSRMHILVQYFLLPLQTLLSQTGSTGSTQSALVRHATQTLLSQTGAPGSTATHSAFVLHATITKFIIENTYVSEMHIFVQ